MYGNGNRMNQNELSVTTLFRSSASRTSLLTLRGWNDKISVIIKPAVGEDSQGVMQYSDRQGQTALTMDACETLSYRFNQEILPVYNKVIAGEMECPDRMSVCIETGKTPKRNMISIEMIKPEKADELPDMYFVLYSSIDDNNIASESNTFKHVFPKKISYVGYNPVNGISEKTVYENADFFMFMNLISNPNMMVPVDYHNGKFMKAKSETYGSKGGNFGNGFGSNNGYNNQQYSNSNSFASQMPGSFDTQPSQGVGFGMFGNDEMPFN